MGHWKYLAVPCVMSETWDMGNTRFFHETWDMGNFWLLSGGIEYGKYLADVWLQLGNSVQGFLCGALTRLNKRRLQEQGTKLTNSWA